VTSAKN